MSTLDTLGQYLIQLRQEAATRLVEKLLRDGTRRACQNFRATGISTKWIVFVGWNPLQKSEDAKLVDRSFL